VSAYAYFTIFEFIYGCLWLCYLKKKERFSFKHSQTFHLFYAYDCEARHTFRIQFNQKYDFKNKNKTKKNKKNKKDFISFITKERKKGILLL